MQVENACGERQELENKEEEVPANLNEFLSKR
jgi:hypothetical protein